MHTLIKSPSATRAPRLHTLHMPAPIAVQAGDSPHCGSLDVAVLGRGNMSSARLPSSPAAGVATRPRPLARGCGCARYASAPMLFF